MGGYGASALRAGTESHAVASLEHQVCCVLSSYSLGPNFLYSPQAPRSGLPQNSSILTTHEAQKQELEAARQRAIYLALFEGYLKTTTNGKAKATSGRLVSPTFR